MNNLEELLVLYALGELEPDEALAVEEELQKRPELAAEVKKVRQADGLLSGVFALSDEAAQQELAKESDKPKVLIKTEPSRSLARHFAFSAAALALVVVVGALLYPQLASKDVQVAMTSQDEENKSASAENVKVEEPTLASKEESDSVEVPEESPHVALDADVADDEVPVAASVDADTAEDVADTEEDASDYPLSIFSPVNQEEPVKAEKLAKEEENATLGIDSPQPAMAASQPPIPPSASRRPAMMPVMAPAMVPKSPATDPEPEEGHAEYYMKNALYDIPGQRTADGMAPIKGEIPSMKKELLPEESLGDLAVEQMNKQLEMQQKRREQKQTLEQNQRGRSVFRMHTYPVQDSYSMLRKSVLEENKLPNPTDVNVEQWLNYFGVAELAKAKEQERQSEETTNKDVQFAKAMNQFGAALSSSDPVDVKDFEAVLDLLKDSVGDDAKRLEFKSIVEKTIEIKKKISE